MDNRPATTTVVTPTLGAGVFANLRKKVAAAKK
jgi:hypothetical protein